MYTLKRACTDTRRFHGFAVPRICGGRWFCHGRLLLDNRCLFKLIYVFATNETEYKQRFISRVKQHKQHSVFFFPFLFLLFFFFKMFYIFLRTVRLLYRIFLRTYKFSTDARRLEQCIGSWKINQTDWKILNDLSDCYKREKRASGCWQLKNLSNQSVLNPTLLYLGTDLFSQDVLLSETRIWEPLFQLVPSTSCYL